MSPKNQALKPDDLCRLIENHAPTLILYARQWNANDAEDIVQDAFLRLVKRVQWEGKPENPVAWLFTVTRNEAIDRTRKAKRRSQYEQQAATERSVGFEVPPDTALRSSELLESLDALTLEQREIVVARIWGGLTFDEIAALTDEPRTTIHRRYAEALKTLRKKLS